MARELLVIGEALIDVVRRPGQEPQRYPGGSPLNVAIGLGRLGHSPRLATWFGGDGDGELILDHCAESQVRLLAGCDQAPYTSTADATLDERGHATYKFDLDSRMVPLPKADWALVHTGSIAAVLEPGASAVLEFVEQMAGQTFISYDPNCRPSIMGDRLAARGMIERYVPAANLVKVSDEDLAWLYPESGSEDWLEQAQRWVASGPSVVVVTMGGRGAWAVTAESAWHIPADDRYGLVDSVGAGDSFMSGMLHGILTGGYSEDFAALAADRTSLEQVLNLAMQTSGVTISRAGANPPWLHELT
ncbi:MAG: carbohydrate kinase [Propionibacteriaceae bacterium]|jgi:fructokinase|nr:carbohydrate kinase [Propionibacteriaceae bacterium]